MSPFKTVLLAGGEAPGTVGVKWDASSIHAGGYTKKIVAFGEVLRPTAASPVQWELTLDSKNVRKGRPFRCVGIIANTAPDVPGRTQDDKTFYGMTSNENNPCQYTGGNCANGRGFFFERGDVLQLTLSADSLTISRRRDGESRTMKVANAAHGGYRAVVMMTSKDRDGTVSFNV